MANVKFPQKLLIFLIIIFLFVNFVHASPPGLPINIYGKVVRGDISVEGTSVIAEWTDESGIKKTSKSSTYTTLDGEKIGDKTLAGHYKFSINAIQNTKIIIESNGKKIEILANPGTPVKVPDLDLSKSSLYESNEKLDDKNIFKTLFDRIKNLLGIKSENNTLKSTNLNKDLNSDSSKNSNPENTNKYKTNNYKPNSNPYENFKENTNSVTQEKISSNQSNNDNLNSNDSSLNNSDGFLGSAKSSSSDEKDTSGNHLSNYSEEILLSKDSNSSKVYEKNLDLSEEEILSKENIQKNKLTTVSQKVKHYITSKQIDKITIIILIVLIILFSTYFLFKKRSKKPSKNVLTVSIKKIEKLESKHLVKDDLLTLSQENNILDAIDIFERESIELIPITVNKTPVGILTKKQILNLNSYAYDYLEKTKIKTIMQKDFIKTGPKTTLGDLYNLLLTSKQPEILLTRNNNLVGTVGFFEILKMLNNSNFEITNPPHIGKAIDKSVHYIDHKMTLTKIKEKFIKMNIDYSIVLNNNTPVGIITLKDLIGAIKKNLDFSNSYAENIMSPRLLFFDPGSPITESFKTILEKRFNQVPIKDNLSEGENKILGIITHKYLIKVYYEFITSLKGIQGNFKIESSYNNNNNK